MVSEDAHEGPQSKEDEAMRSQPIESKSKRALRDQQVIAGPNFHKLRSSGECLLRAETLEGENTKEKFTVSGNEVGGNQRMHELSSENGPNSEAVVNDALLDMELLKVECGVSHVGPTLGPSHTHPQQVRL